MKAHLDSLWSKIFFIRKNNITYLVVEIILHFNLIPELLYFINNIFFFNQVCNLWLLCDLLVCRVVMKEGLIQFLVRVPWIVGTECEDWKFIYKLRLILFTCKVGLIDTQNRFILCRLNVHCISEVSYYSPPKKDSWFLF